MICDELAVLKGKDTVGAGGCKNFGACSYCLFYSEIRKPFMFLCLHPYPASSHSTAQAVFTGIGHFNQFETGDALQDPPGLVVYLVVATKIAGIMIGHFLRIFLIDGESSLIDQLKEVFGKMNNLEVDHEFGILILEGMVAMRRRDQNLLHSAFHKVLDIFLGQPFEQCLVACLTDRLAAAHLLGTKDSEVDTSLLKDRCRCLGDLFQPGVIAGITAGEIENLGRFIKFFNSEILCPVCPVIRFLTPGITYAGKTRHCASEARKAGRNNTVGNQKPPDGPHYLDRFHTPGTPLTTAAAGDTEPNVFRFERNNT